MQRAYTDKGLLSKDSALMVFDETLSKYVLLVPTTDLPETKGAPSTQAKTVLTDHSVTEVEGLQTNSQKTYTFNYHRDNINQLIKSKGKVLKFLEVNPDYTGEKFTGSYKFGRSAVSVDGIVQGQIFLTVASSEENPIEDVRDVIANTSILTTPLIDEVEITGTGTYELSLETDPTDATITVESASTSIATASFITGKLTITGVTTGVTKVTITVSKTGEASSFRTLLVKVSASI